MHACQIGSWSGWTIGARICPLKTRWSPRHSCSSHDHGIALVRYLSFALFRFRNLLGCRGHRTRSTEISSSTYRQTNCVFPRLVETLTSLVLSSLTRQAYTDVNRSDRIWQGPTRRSPNETHWKSAHRMIYPAYILIHYQRRWKPLRNWDPVRTWKLRLS